MAVASGVDALTTALAAAIPVLVGGVLAVAGGVIGNIVTHVLEAQRETSNRRRDKLELVIELVQQAHHHAERLKANYLFSGALPDEPSPADRLIALGNLYFPELRAELSAYDIAFTGYARSCIELAQMRGSEMRRFTAEELAKYDDAYRPLLRARSELVRAASTVMRTLP